MCVCVCGSALHAGYLHTQTHTHTHTHTHKYSHTHARDRKEAGMEQRLTCSGAQRDDWEATWAQAVANMRQPAKPVSRLIDARQGRD